MKGNLSDADFRQLYAERGFDWQPSYAVTQHGNFLIYWYRVGSESWTQGSCETL